jgi:septum formation protein
MPIASIVPLILRTPACSLIPIVSSTSAPLQLHLASRSPRRAAFLQQLGLRFSVVDVDVPEVPAPGQSPADYALQVALAKAHAGIDAARSQLPVLSADTDVAVDGFILGKPVDRADAIRMLLQLADREHEVNSAVVVAQGARIETVICRTRVRFTPISTDEAAAYCDTGEPFGKAGAYAIQGAAARWVRAIEGSYTNIVGLPLAETAELLQHFGIAVSFPIPGSAP